MSSMIKIQIDQSEEEILSFEVSDQVLESAADETAVNFTMADCTTVYGCPAW